MKALPHDTARVVGSGHTAAGNTTELHDYLAGRVAEAIANNATDTDAGTRDSAVFHGTVSDAVSAVGIFTLTDNTAGVFAGRCNGHIADLTAGYFRINSQTNNTAGIIELGCYSTSGDDAVGNRTIFNVANYATDTILVSCITYIYFRIGYCNIFYSTARTVCNRRCNIAPMTFGIRIFKEDYENQSFIKIKKVS